MAEIATNHSSRLLWWGRFDPEYSRNRVLRSQLAALGWQIVDFHPRFSKFGDLEAHLRGIPTPDAVWVPCFRQRDLRAAARWARHKGKPVIFDPLISAYDKQVDERAKIATASRAAHRLLDWEQALFQQADLILADTTAHAQYFHQTLHAPKEKIAVVYVGAEKTLFFPGPLCLPKADAPLEILFYGSFLHLQGPQVVIEAARLYDGPPVRWTLLGDGPLRGACEQAAQGLASVQFEDWLPYLELPERIRHAHILLGVFGTTAKAGRVIPNKVFQSLACGRVVVTRESDAYPPEMRTGEGFGLIWTKAGDARDLAECIASLARARDSLVELGHQAANASQTLFSEESVRRQLATALKTLPFARNP